jgi:hypothetical protein
MLMVAVDQQFQKRHGADLKVRQTLMLMLIILGYSEACMQLT